MHAGGSGVTGDPLVRMVAPLRRLTGSDTERTRERMDMEERTRMMIRMISQIARRPRRGLREAEEEGGELHRDGEPDVVRCGYIDNKRQDVSFHVEVHGLHWNSSCNGFRNVRVLESDSILFEIKIEHSYNYCDRPMEDTSESSNLNIQ